LLKKRHNHYSTISEAITKLHSQGFTLDFNLANNSLITNPNKFDSDFEIVDIYRYEGDSDPADAAVVYALQSKSGLKGILVSGYGTSVDTETTLMLEKLPIKKIFNQG